MENIANAVSTPEPVKSILKDSVLSQVAKVAGKCKIFLCKILLLLHFSPVDSTATAVPVDGNGVMSPKLPEPIAKSKPPQTSNVNAAVGTAAQLPENSTDLREITPTNVQSDKVEDTEKSPAPVQETATSHRKAEGKCKIFLCKMLLLSHSSSFDSTATAVPVDGNGVMSPKCPEPEEKSEVLLAKNKRKTDGESSDSSFDEFTPKKHRPNKLLLENEPDKWFELQQQIMQKMNQDSCNFISELKGQLASANEKIDDLNQSRAQQSAEIKRLNDDNTDALEQSRIQRRQFDDEKEKLLMKINDLQQEVYNLRKSVYEKKCCFHCRRTCGRICFV